MLACEQWIANDCLIRHGLPPGPTCGDDPANCPPQQLPTEHTMTDPDRDLAASYFNQRLAAGYGNIPADHLAHQRERYIADTLASPAAMAQLRDSAERVDALQAELAACRAAGRVARAAEQQRRDTREDTP